MGHYTYIIISNIMAVKTQRLYRACFFLLPLGNSTEGTAKEFEGWLFHVTSSRIPQCKHSHSASSGTDAGCHSMLFQHRCSGHTRSFVLDGDPMTDCPTHRAALQVQWVWARIRRLTGLHTMCPSSVQWMRLVSRQFRTPPRCNGMVRHLNG